MLEFILALTIAAPAASDAVATATPVADEITVERRRTWLDQQLENHPEEPVLLLQLATRELRDGNVDGARDAYRKVLASRDRYDVELIDGRWIDSRDAARRALGSMEDARRMAVR